MGKLVERDIRHSYPVFDFLLDLPIRPVPEIKSLLRLSPVSYAYRLIHNSSPLSKMVKYCHVHYQKIEVLATQQTCRPSIEKILHMAMKQKLDYIKPKEWGLLPKDAHNLEMLRRLTLHICLTGKIYSS